EVKPKGGVGGALGNTTKEVYISSYLPATPTIRDTALCNTTVTATYVADAEVKKGTDEDGSYLTGDLYESGIPVTQVITINTDAYPKVASYFVRIRQDGNTDATITVTGTGNSSDGKWTVTYYDGSTWTNNVSDAVKNGSYSVALKAFSSVTNTWDGILKVEVSCDNTVSLYNSYQVIVRAKPLSSNNIDTVATSTIRQAQYQPDVYIKRYLDNDSAYTVKGLPYQTSVTTTQISSSSTLNPSAASYYVKIENVGLQDGTFSVTGVGGGSGWTVVYLDASGSDGNITAKMTGAGYTTTLTSLATKTVRVDVTPDANVIGNTLYPVTVTAYATSAWANVDACAGWTTVTKTYKADAWVKTESGAYQGDNDDTIGNQTVEELNRPRLTPTTYYVRIENDGDYLVLISMTGTSGNINWAVSYYDGDTDITSAVTGSGWNNDGLTYKAFNGLYGGGGDVNYKEVKILVTPLLYAVPGVPYDVYVTLREMSGSPAQIDTALMRTSPATAYQPDLWTSRINESDYEGNDLYYPVITTTKSLSVVRNSPAVYYLKLQNDANTSDTLTVASVDAGNTDWDVKFFDGAVGITQDVITAGGYSSIDMQGMSPGASKVIRLEVTPTISAAGTTSYPVVVILSRTGAGEDRIKTTTTVDASFQPDNMAATDVGGPYTGDGTYDDGTTQVVAATPPITKGGTATYYIRIGNDGNMTDSFTVNGTGDDAYWTVNYFVNDTGEDITAKVGDGNYTINDLAAGAITPTIIRVVVFNSDPSIYGGYYKDALVTSRSWANPDKVDTVKTRTQVVLESKPNNWINIVDEAGYIGQSFWNEDATGQTWSTINKDNGASANYYVRIYNDGNGPESYTVTATATPVGWTVSYYQGFAYTKEIYPATSWTTDNLNPGSFNIIRITVTPGNNVIGNTEFPLYITARSATGVADAVKCVTKVTARYQPDNLVTSWVTIVSQDGDKNNKNNYKIAPNNFDNSYDPTPQEYPTGGYSNIVIGQVPSYYVWIENDGNTNEVFTISGTGSDSNWTVTYYSDSSGGNISPDVNDGTKWITLDPQQKYLMWLEANVKPGTAYGTEKVFTIKTTHGPQSKVDTVKLKLKVTQIFKTDLVIRNVQPAGDNDDIGNDYFTGQNLATPNAIGNQTRATISCDIGQVVKYSVTLANEGDGDDDISVTATPAGSDWVVTYYYTGNSSYYDAGGTDITNQMTSIQGWWTTYAVLEKKYIRVEVTPLPSAGVGNVKEIDVFAYSTKSPDTDLNAGQDQDTVRCQTSAQTGYQADLYISLTGTDGTFIGDDTRNDTGVGQTMANTVYSSQATSYYIRVQNDGNVYDRFILTGTGSSAGWSIAYYTYPTMTAITSMDTGWTSANLSPGGYDAILLLLTPGVLSGGATTDIYIRARSQASGTNVDMLKIVPTINVSRQVDTMVKRGYLDDSYYLVEGVADIASQTTSYNLTNNQTISYHIRLENDGNVDDIFSVTVSPTAVSGWAVTYYNAETGGTPINTEITSPAGYQPLLGAGSKAVIRMEVTPSGSVPGGSQLAVDIKAQSIGAPAQAESVRTVTMVTAQYQTDLSIALTTTAYSGNDIYDTSATSQTITSDIVNNQTIIYYIRVENDGNTSDTFSITRQVTPSAASGWTISYYDGTNDVTPQITQTYGGYPVTLADKATRDLRVEIRAGSALSGGSTLELLTSGVSTVDNLKKDAVKVFINLPINDQPDNIIRVISGTDYTSIGNDEWNTSAENQTYSAIINAGIAVTYYLRIQNDGNRDDAYTVLQSGNVAGWTVSYYEGNNNRTSAVISVGGWLTGTFAGFGYYKDIAVVVTSASAGLNEFSITTISAARNPNRKDTVKFILTVGEVSSGLAAGESTPNTGLTPEVNLEGKTVGLKPVLIGKCAPNQMITIKDNSGVVVGSGSSDDNGYYRIAVTQTLSAGPNTLAPWIGANTGVPINVTVVDNPTPDQVPQVTGLIADVTIDQIDPNITPTLRPILGKIKIKGKGKPGKKVVAQMASTLDLNIGEATVMECPDRQAIQVSSNRHRLYIPDCPNNLAVRLDRLYQYRGSPGGRRIPRQSLDSTGHNGADRYPG
ncbi:MAG: hypothetical protein HY762_02135, partial [Planctomycetes bacterium]|nr:hypothetical protein [Planctomycetota bacterium]